jgi:signal transduction histidine kinase
MSTNTKSATIPDSTRAGLVVVETAPLLDDAERALFHLHLELVKAAPGAALIVWGPEAICLAHNRAYRAIAALRGSILGKSLFTAQPELERALRPKLEQVLAGHGAAIDGIGFTATSYGDGPGRSTGAENHVGWLLPVTDGDGAVRGALAFFVDVTPVIDPYRRVLQTVAEVVRDVGVGVRFIAERLMRFPKLTIDRCTTDAARILDITGDMERTAFDMSAFARLAGGSPAMNFRPGDLGALVQAVCEQLVPSADHAASTPVRPDASLVPRSGAGAQAAPPPYPPGPKTAGAIHVSVAEVHGVWDVEAIRSIVANMVAAVRKQGSEGSDITVSVSVARDGGVLTVRGDGKGLFEEEIDMFDPSRRTQHAPLLDRRRTAAGLGLYVARELVQAHGGRLSVQRLGPTSFVVRAVFPPGGGNARRP